MDASLRNNNAEENEDEDLLSSFSSCSEDLLSYSDQSMTLTTTTQQKEEQQQEMEEESCSSSLLSSSSTPIVDTCGIVGGGRVFGTASVSEDAHETHLDTITVPTTTDGALNVPLLLDEDTTHIGDMNNNIKQTKVNSTHMKNDSTSSLLVPTENEPQEEEDWNKIAQEWNDKTPLLLQQSSSKLSTLTTCALELKSTNQHPLQNDDINSSYTSLTQMQQHSNTSLLHTHDEEEEEESDIHSNTMKGFVRPWEAYVSLVSSSLVLVFVTCVIGAFFFPWSDTMLRIRIPTKHVIDGVITQGNVIEFDLPLYKDATFQTTLSIFQASHSTLMVILILASTLVLPSCWILIHPFITWAVHQFSVLIHHNQQQQHHQHQNDFTNDNDHDENEKHKHQIKMMGERYFTLTFHRRIGSIMTIMEYLFKYCLSITYVQALLLICTSNVQYQLGGEFAPPDSVSVSDAYISSSSSDDDDEHLSVRVVTDTRGGMISYLVGVSMGVLALVLVRMHWRRQVSMMDMASTPISAPAPGAQAATSTSISKIIAFESGLISLLLVIPAYTLPILSLSYTGLSSPALTLPLDSNNNNITQHEYGYEYEHQELNLVTYTFWDIVRTILQDSRGSGLFTWITNACLLINICLMPCVVFVIHVILWFYGCVWNRDTVYGTNDANGTMMASIGRSKSMKVLYRLLRYAYTGSNSTVFGLGICFTTLALGNVSDYLFNENGVCEMLGNVNAAIRIDADAVVGDDGSGEKCLMMNGELLLGFWLFVVQSVAMDVFVAALK